MISTYEDGCVVSKSAAKKLTSYKVEKTMLSVNSNDVLLNLYGNGDIYQSFPRIGEEIHNKILVASRRIDKRTMLYDFQSTKMREVDPTSDEVFYTGGGRVVDIDIFCNMKLEDLKKKNNIFDLEILELLENQQRYWKELCVELEKIIPCLVLTDEEYAEEKKKYGIVIRHPIPREQNPNKYTEELGYYWKLAHESLDERIPWRSDGKSFDNFKLQFTILKENPLTTSCKLSGRYRQQGYCCYDR